MPFGIDETVFKKRSTFDVSAPQGSATGIPIKQIPHAEYPRVVYKHPSEPFRTILHRNAKHEVVLEETVPTEHLSKLAQDKDEFEGALKDGWVDKPYIAQEPSAADDSLYAKKAKK